MNQPPRRSATGITGWRKATASDLRTPAESSRLHDQGALEISRFSCMLFLSVRGFLDYAGPDSHSRLTRLPCCLPPTRQGVGILIWRFSKLNHPAHRCLRPTLRNTSRDGFRKTRGQDGVAVSFPAGLFHPLQHAGLSRRTPYNAQTAQLASSPLIF